MAGMEEGRRVVLHARGGECCIWSAAEASYVRRECRLLGKLVGTVADTRSADERLMRGLPMLLLPEEVLLLLERPGVYVAGWPERPAGAERDAPPGPEAAGPVDAAADVPPAKRSNVPPPSRAPLDRVTVPYQSLGDDGFEPPAGWPPWSAAALGPFRRFYVEHVFPAGRPAMRLRACVYRALWKRGFYLSSGLKFGGDYLVYEDDPFHVHARLVVTCIDADEPLGLVDLVSWGRLAVSVKKSAVFASLLDPAADDVSFLTIDWRGV